MSAEAGSRMGMEVKFIHFPPSQPINSNEPMLHLTCALRARCQLRCGSPGTNGGHRKRSLDIQIFPLFIFFPLFPLSLRKLTGNGRFRDSTELRVKANPAVLGFIIITSWN